MTRLRRVLLAWFVFCPAVAAALPTVGRIENVRIEPAEVVLRAKLDTGADHSSITAQRVEFFEKQKEKWARLTIRARDGEETVLELKIEKTTTIKRERGRVETRPVVRLGVCLGNFYMLVNVNLNDRTDFMYPMLIGLDYITGHLIVDPSQAYTVQPSCVVPGKKKANKKSREEKKH